MSINNHTLTSSFLELNIPVNDLMDHFSIIIKLLKRHWKNISAQYVIDSIKNSDENTYQILMFLIRNNKAKITSIKAIGNLIKKQSENYIPSFELNTIETTDSHDIKEKIKDKFNQCNINTKQNKVFWIFVNWEGWYYKRDIEQDLQKLLW